VTVDQRKTHGERLSEANHRVVNGRVAVRVVLADDVADRTGGFHMGLGGQVAGLVHSVENAAMNGLQTVADIGQRSGDDNAHGVLKERRLHLLAKISRAHDGALAAVGVFDDGSMRTGHVDDHRLSALFLRNEALVFFSHIIPFELTGERWLKSVRDR